MAARSGCWHVVDDEPARVQEVLTYWLIASTPRVLSMCRSGWPVWWRAPTPSLFFTRSTCTSNTRFGRETGWRPRYPTFREGLDQIVATWASTAP
ncbi:hypothetical protein [Rhodothermus marinus]|uniref:hypothetical protein n=1 Tax=Rhodothermus marinus TaxID=29549 RepID=UPI001FB38CF7|nr:hypothetical protein [Rhodothermus marinus]